jgi:hypothetical protein
LRIEISFGKQKLIRAIKELSVHGIEDDSLEKLESCADPANAAPVASFRLYLSRYERPNAGSEHYSFRR